jgi:hypothetical protein
LAWIDSSICIYSLSLLTQSMSILGGGHGSRNLNESVGSDPNATNPCVCVSYIKTIETALLRQSALLTQSTLLTQSALLTQSKLVLPGGSGEGCVSSDLIPVSPAVPMSWTSLFTPSLAIAEDGNGTEPCISVTDASSAQNLNNSENRLLYQTPPSSPNTRIEHDNVYVTPSSSPAVTRAGRTTMCPTRVVGLGAVQSAGPPQARNRQRPRLSDNFKQTPVPSTNSIKHAQTNPKGQAPVANIAGPPEISRLDFIQIN